MIGKFHLPIPAGGAAPDPATYCPANGYILNPINPADGWVLLLEFQTNSPSTTTFDPTITASSGEYAWDLGDGTILVGDKAVSHTYLTTVTRTVKLYGKGTCSITQVDFRSDNIVGVLDVSNDAFKAASVYYLGVNANLTSIIFPTTPTASIQTLQIYSTGIIGILDLSMFGSYTVTATALLYSNSSMTGVLFSSSTSGFIRTLSIFSSASVGYIDITSLSTGVDTLGWRFDNNGWTAAIVNHVLADIDSITVAGYTGTINIGGTNADPDSSSGGYDGVAARNSLIAKGFTVTIT